MQRIIYRLLCFCILLGSFNSVKAIDEKYAAPALRGNQLARDSTSIVMDTVYFNPQLKPLQTTWFVKNLITFQIDESYRHVLPDVFNVSVTFKIHYTRDLNGKPVTGQSDTLTLGIEYSKNTSYKNKEVYIGNDWYRVEVEMISINGSGNLSDYRDALVLTNEIMVNREYNFSCTNNAITKVSSNSTTVATKGELNVFWTPERAADEYDLEWTYIDDLAKGNYYKAGTQNFDPRKLFANNATRVSIRREDYNIPLLYEAAGQLFYRVRAVQVRRDGQRMESVWSSDYTGGLGTFSFAGLDSTLNWQASTSFAEEGKRKSVVQYFDGSLKSRQTVTKDNTTDTTIIAETFYDHQGRPVVQVMPTPSLSSIIRFTPGFNRLNSANEYRKDSYDSILTADCYCNQGAPVMDNAQGAAQYYSPNNPLKTNGYHKYIPDAKGYVFAETRYTPDNTGRISIQSGVGETFQIGKGHETKYTYDAADPEELDALFGTEVGDASHYFKNTVRDANGQVSVSYVDMHGRTIATALADSAVARLDALSSNKSYFITKKLIDSNSNVVKGTVIESSKGLVVTKAGPHRFMYSMLPDSISIQGCDARNICYDCIYDLRISITDECNNTTFTNGAPILINRSNGAADTACNIIGPLPAIDTTIYLQKGSYLVTKTLTVNKKAMDYYRDSVFLIKNTCRTLEQTIQEQKIILANKIQCEPSCDSCTASLGNWETFRNNYLEQSGIPDSDTAAYRQQAEIAYQKEQDECKKICDGLAQHQSIREQMLADVSPPYGQYANPDNLDEYSIFWAPNDEGQNYKNVSVYLNENGQWESPDPRDMDQETFIASFKSSWAEALLEKHPEYPKLVKYNAFAASNTWDQQFGKTETFQDAVAKGYLNPGDFGSHPSGPNFTYNANYRDPFFTDYITDNKVSGVYKARMQDSLLTRIHDANNNSVSMWSMATMLGRCAGNDAACMDRYRSMDSAFVHDPNCSGEMDMAWKYFREMYLQEKRELIAEILREAQQQSTFYPDLTNLANNHQLNFYDPTLMPTGDMPTSEQAVRDSIQVYINDNCAAYVNQWWEELRPCGYNSTDSAWIVPHLIQVCREGGDLEHFFGASSVKPSSTYQYRSFEQVLKAYAVINPDRPYNAICNVYLISTPLPYDQQPVYTNKPVLQKPDSCECATIGSLYAKYQSANSDTTFAGYLYKTTGTRITQGALDTLRLSCNGQINCNFLQAPVFLPPVLQCGVKDVCVSCGKFNTLYGQYLDQFPGSIPAPDNGDSLQTEKNKLFERFMNAKLGYGKTATEYLEFKENCGSGTPCGTLREIFKSYNQWRLTDSSDFNRNRITPEDQWTYWRKDIYKNGFAHIPDEYVNTANYGSHYLKNDTICTGNVFTYVTRFKRPGREERRSEMVIQVRYRDDAGSTLIGPAFYLYGKNPLASDTAVMLSRSGMIGFGREGNYNWPTKPFVSDYFDWTEVKITHSADNIWRVYFNDTLVNERYTPLPVIKIEGFQVIFQGRANNGYVDYHKVYDQDNKLQYIEEFEDPFHSPSNDPKAFRCPDTCQVQFTRYYNLVTNSSLTYAQIQKLYSECDISLEPCSYDTLDIALCGKAEPVIVPDDWKPRTACDDIDMFSTSTGVLLHESYRDSLLGSFNDRYLAKCLSARYNESFTVYQPISEFHYTLYYYDQAGNLLKTIPPEGVDISKFAWARAWSDSVTAARRNRQRLTPRHTLPTLYRYNTLNQVVAQRSPDGGRSDFWYDRLGRLVISRNARQKAASGTEENRLYSYTKYDSLGRITEVGQVSNMDANGAMSNVISRNQALLNNWLQALHSRRGQITNTVYDLPYPGFDGVADKRLIISQRNLRNRVSYTTLTDTGTSNAYNQGTFYTYDILGNVDHLLQDYGSSSFGSTANVMNKNGNRWKKISYEYDLVSGKVNMVMFQHGWRDGFFHRYSYDGENRLTLVETSRDSLVWEKDARYDYYRHGPLARVTLGEQQVQGIDYAYTLQGWLKGINSTGGTDSIDMGEDGHTGSWNQFTARDALGLTLNYFGNDYTAINGNPFPAYSAYLGNAYRPLYNGNISSSSVYQKKFDYANSPGGPLIFYNYKYDQLNRLTAQDAYKGFNSSSNSWSGLASMNENLKERIAYDANGNIQKYLRKSITGTTADMDSLNYYYYPGTNRLRRVTDNVAASAFVSQNNRIIDIDNEPDNNYGYDAIGNLIKDSAEKITSIKWNVYGKIQEISRVATTEVPATNIKYSYDAMGNRIGQEVTSGGTKYYTWYVRDAQGNIMSTYKAEGNNSDLTALRLKLTDRFLYGSSRLGTVMVNDDNVDGGPGSMQYYYEKKWYERGYKEYELINHLGNVLATVSDRKFGVPSAGSSLISYYEPHIVTAQDYYPFGMMSRVSLPNSGKAYKFGFNGKMNDDEVKGGLGGQQDYGMRVYDPRVGRFLSVDPLTKIYPWLSPYQYAENSPIANIDLDGLESAYAADGRIVNGPWQRDPLTGGRLYGGYLPGTFAYYLDQSKKALQKPSAQPKLIKQDALQSPQLKTAIKAKEGMNVAAIDEHIRKYGIGVPINGKPLPQATVDKPRPDYGYTDFEYGMVTNPATQASALTLAPAVAITYGGMQTYSGIETGNYLEAGSGLLNIMGGVGMMLPKPLNGSGPGKGIIEVSSRMKSSNAFKNSLSLNARDFVFDPVTNRFVMATADSKLGHTVLMRSIGANENIAVGGRIKLNEFGVIETSQWSGHYNQNWTLEVADQFKVFIKKQTGVEVQHSYNMNFQNGTGH